MLISRPRGLPCPAPSNSLLVQDAMAAAGLYAAGVGVVGGPGSRVRGREYSAVPASPLAAGRASRHPMLSPSSLESLLEDPGL